MAGGREAGGGGRAGTFMRPTQMTKKNQQKMIPEAPQVDFSPLVNQHVMPTQKLLKSESASSVFGPG